MSQGIAIRSDSEITALLLSGQGDKLTDDEKKHIRSLARKAGVLPKGGGISKADMTPEQIREIEEAEAVTFLTAHADMKGVVAAFVEKIAPMLKETKSYLRFAFDARGMGVCQIVEIWRVNKDGKNEMHDDWEGPRGSRPVNLRKK